jgi:hypothetical protein
MADQIIIDKKQKTEEQLSKKTNPRSQTNKLYDQKNNFAQKHANHMKFNKKSENSLQEQKPSPTYFPNSNKVLNQKRLLLEKRRSN